MLFCHRKVIIRGDEAQAHQDECGGRLQSPLSRWHHL